jgi:NAD(P)-dependent dehydrogenase (short-subunit alcohol dehydrogenase family)
MSGRYRNKVALVTAAGGGIGEATAEAFVQDGARVMCADIDRERGEAVAARLRAAGGVAEFCHADGTQEEDVVRLVRRTVETFGALDVAANIIGDAVLDAYGPEFHLQSLAGWEGTVAVCLRSTFLCLKHEIATMLEHGGGAICNVTSLAGLLYVPDAGAAYSAAKAGVVQLTRFAALNYAERGIRVNCIAPGTTPTAAYQKAGPEAARMLIERLLQGHAIKRTTETREQAAAILWLCSDDAAMVTGHTLPVDGGWSAR